MFTGLSKLISEKIMSKLESKNELPQQKIEPARRKALKQLSLLFVGTLSASSIALAAQGYQAKHETIDRDGEVLSKEKLKLLALIVDLILPATETPAASALDVHGFIDHQLKHCYGAEQQDAFVNGLERLDQLAVKTSKTLFNRLSESQQIALLTEMELGKTDVSPLDKEFIHQLKALTLLGYYTSEVGASQELSYLTIPGGYKGDFPFSSVGKAWAF